MINSKFYDGYEGEGQVIFSDEKKNELVIWEGYIYVLMERMFNQGYKILADFYSREDDEHPWIIPSINNAITQFKSFNMTNIEQDSFTECFPEIINEISSFLMKAFEIKQKVYIRSN